MLVLIIRDGGATKIPKEVADMDAVEALRAAGHVVEVPEAEEAPTIDGDPDPAVVAATETVICTDGTAVIGVAPLPADSPAKKAASKKAKP